MTLFSQRKGIRPLAKTIQRESMDDDLRNRLWSGIKLALWDRWFQGHRQLGSQSVDCREVEHVVELVWLNYFKLPLDKLPPFNPDNPRFAYGILREHFLTGEWWESYDLLEFLTKAAPKDWKELLKEFANSFLESENAAYRVVGDEVVEITDEYEMEAVETALDKGIKQSRIHLSRSLELLSDRKRPDFRNSIKESISAVESASQVISGKNKAALGDCIKAIKTKGTIHPAFEQALLKLYGYTSDEGGIRHALTEESNDPSYADAKFMLVSCAAFINFLWTKAAEARITIPES
jgi:hypothetical protein